MSVHWLIYKVAFYNNYFISYIYEILVIKYEYASGLQNRINSSSEG